MFDKAEVSASGLLPVDDVHEIYWEEAGNPDGIPALYLHGGPGGSLKGGGYRGKLDPSRFRIIGLDQRGCGRSTPRVTATGYDLNQNTTGDLIDDIEKLREHLRVDRWLVNGVSWGSSLALAYAQAHPERVTGIVAMAVTTTNRFEVDWITETVGAIYPEAWDRLAVHAEQAGIGYHRGEGRLIEAYARLMTQADPAVRDAASHAWCDWEDHHVSIGAGGFHRNPRWDDDDHRHVFATLVTHYWAYDGFLTPPILAWRLHRAWPDSELIIVEDEGHGGGAMVEAWCSANSRHADRLGAQH